MKHAQTAIAALLPSNAPLAASFTAVMAQTHAANASPADMLLSVSIVWFTSKFITDYEHNQMICNLLRIAIVNSKLFCE